MHVEFYVFGLLKLQVLDTQPMQTVTMDLISMALSWQFYRR